MFSNYVGHFYFEGRLLAGLLKHLHQNKKKFRNMLLINALSGRHSFLATAILVGLIGCLFVDTFANALLVDHGWTGIEPGPDPIEPGKEPVEHTVCDTNEDEQMTDHVCHVLVLGEIKEGKPCCARKKFKKEKFCRKKVNRVGHNALNEKAKVNLAKAFRCIVVLLQSLSGVVTPETMDCCTHLRIGKKFPVCKKIGASTPPPSPDLSTSSAPTPPGGSPSTSSAPTPSTLR